MSDRHTPEFVYLLAKLGSAMPYRKAAALLREFLPLRPGEVSYGNVRRRTLAVGDELERRATDRAEYDEYGPGRKAVTGARQITVALDGTWIRADGTKLSVLADGADGLPGLVHDGTKRTPIAQLDWFHVSMRLRHIEQMTPKTAVLMEDSETECWVRKHAMRLRWLVWHGRAMEVLPLLTRLSREAKIAMRSSGVAAHERLGRFRRHAVELRRYLRNNSRGLINYGCVWRNGQRISTAPAESGMGHLIKERMGGGSPFAGLRTALIGYCKCAVPSSMTDSTSFSENGTHDFNLRRGPWGFVGGAA
jgi:hypothetical protein